MAHQDPLTIDAVPWRSRGPKGLNPGRSPLRLVLFALMVVAVAAGVVVTAGHLVTDPLADVRAYYDAGARLNAGQPLYPAGADTNAAAFYRYPPLLAIVFRPLALLPYGLVAPAWGIAMLAAFTATLWRLGVRPTMIRAVALLALPIGWALAVGQAQVLVTLLVAIGSPWAVAVAGNLKLFPALIGLFWLGRREWRRLALLIGWGMGLLAVQFALEPSGTTAYLGFPNLDQVGQVNNLSPYAISPLLWALLTAVGGLAAVRLAPGRWGWPAAVALSVLATPRLLSYQLMTLLAGLRSPEASRPREPGAPR
jgi:alpha-1,2-mannosyltransferase